MRIDLLTLISCFDLECVGVSVSLTGQSGSSNQTQHCCGAHAWRSSSRDLFRFGLCRCPDLDQSPLVQPRVLQVTGWVKMQQSQFVDEVW